MDNPQIEIGLSEAVNRWTEITLDALEIEIREKRQLGLHISQDDETSQRNKIYDIAKILFRNAAAFDRDNSSETAEGLETLAAGLSPSGTHAGGLLIGLIRSTIWNADPLLLAAAIRYNWQGSKLHFQFLPDPAEVDLETYDAEAWSLLALFDDATQGNPGRILTGGDLDFFKALPERFTIYRGCAGISVAHAGSGVCWTTKRTLAEWFAARSARLLKADPILLTARVKKDDIRLARAEEFEVVTIPARFRILKYKIPKPS
jgi:hypothetical protein